MIEAIALLPIVVALVALVSVFSMCDRLDEWNRRKCDERMKRAKEDK